MSTAAGLVYLEPKAAIQQRHRVRTANGVADIKTNERFAIMISNFWTTPKCLPKGTVVAYAQRNPLAIHALPDKASRTLESVLHLPFERTEVADETDGIQPTHPEPSKSAPTDWRTTVNLEHIGDAGLRKRVIEMLETHQDMWTSGRLGEISATEHRIDLEPGTKPIRSMPYRQGPALRDKDASEIRKMLDAGVIEPATSEWASPIVLVPKKDGSLRFLCRLPPHERKDCCRRLSVTAYWRLPRLPGRCPDIHDSRLQRWLLANARSSRGPRKDDVHLISWNLSICTYDLRITERARNIPMSPRYHPERVRWQTCLIYFDDVIVCSKDAENALKTC